MRLFAISSGWLVTSSKFRNEETLQGGRGIGVHRDASMTPDKFTIVV